MICDYCGEDKDDVEVVADPFDSEIEDDYTKHAICDECYTTRAEEV